MARSGIEWTEETWNPIVGCSIISPGCRHCYAMGEAARLQRINAAARAKGLPAVAPQYDGTTLAVNGRPVWSGKLALAGDNILMRPLKRKKPTTYFVNSMGDLFHEDAPDEWIDRAFTVMALSPQHTFQVLTKRPDRMREYLTRLDQEPVSETARRLAKAWPDNCRIPIEIVFPLPNVWLGVSCERQQEANERIPLLLQTPAAVRFISAEPLLGPIDLHEVIPDPLAWNLKHGFDGLDWVICGGESGPGSRPMHPAWARSLRDQCLAAGVPFFFKQWGDWHPRHPSLTGVAEHCLAVNGAISRGDELRGGGGGRERWIAMDRVGKKRAGRLLDGVTHDAMPEARAA